LTPRGRNRPASLPSWRLRSPIYNALGRKDIHSCKRHSANWSLQEWSWTRREM
jgi:hypothetical protein